MARLMMTTTKAPVLGPLYFEQRSSAMPDQAKVNEAQLVTAIKSLKDVSPEKLEDAYLALEEEHGADAVGRARALLAVEERATQIKADIERLPVAKPMDLRERFKARVAAADAQMK